MSVEITIPIGWHGYIMGDGAGGEVLVLNLKGMGVSSRPGVATLKEAIARLNEWIALDPNAMTHLLMNQVACNERLAERDEFYSSEYLPVVGMMRCIRALFGFGADDGGEFVSIFHEETGLLERVAFRPNPFTTFDSQNITKPVASDSFFTDNQLPILEEPKDFRLFIFDADGTLIDRDSGAYLPGVAGIADGLSQYAQVAIATNQGGPACRDADWPWSSNFPTLEEIEASYGLLAQRMGARLYMSLAYRTKGGALIFPKGVPADDPRLDPSWRKPEPGMIIQAMRDAYVTADQTVFIGDGKEDEQAAAAAGVRFIPAGKFFIQRGAATQ